MLLVVTSITKFCSAFRKPINSADTKSSELFNKNHDVSISSLNVEIMFQQNESDFSFNF